MLKALLVTVNALMFGFMGYLWRGPWFGLCVALGAAIGWTLCLALIGYRSGLIGPHREKRQQFHRGRTVPNFRRDVSFEDVQEEIFTSRDYNDRI